jgi:hypothetical protein
VDGYGSKWKKYAKRGANRRVRHAVNVPDGGAYRKYYDPWNICDYRFQYDPQPRIYWWRGYPEVIEPDPLWKITRK